MFGRPEVGIEIDDNVIDRAVFDCEWDSSSMAIYRFVVVQPSVDSAT